MNISPKSGYTLVELIIVMAITAIIMAALLFFFSGSITSYRSQIGHVFATADARNQLQRITDVIRNTQDSTANDWLQEAGDDAIAVYTDVEGDGTLEKVAYRRGSDATQLIREVTVSGNTSTNIIMRNIANTEAVFTYYDASGNSISGVEMRTSLTVKNIGVTITVSSNNPQDTDSQTVSTRITPRSKLQGDVSQIIGPVATREVNIQLPRGNPPASNASTNIVIKNPDTGATISSTTVPFSQLNDGRLSVYANKLYAILNYKTDTGLGNPAGWYVWIAKSVPVISSLFQLPLQSLYTAQCLGVSWATVQASSTSSCAPLDTALYPISSTETFQPILAYTENGNRDYVRDISANIFLPPVASPPGGSYATAQSVSLSAEAGAAIRYTVNGSTPTVASMLYSSEITINSSTTLKAIAIDADGNISSVMTEVYTFAFANGANATDLIGQYVNHNPLQPKYTQGLVNDGQAIVDELGYDRPYDVAIDTLHHRLFVSDRDNSRVLVYNLSTDTNTLIDRVPDYVLGQPNFSSSQLRGANAFNEPIGLAYDSNHNRLFVTDTKFNQLFVFDVTQITNGELPLYIIGQPFDEGASEPPISSTYLYDPYAAVYDNQRNILYLSDHINSRILIYNGNTMENNAVPVHVLGQTGYGTRATGTGSNKLGGVIRGLALDSVSNLLYVADTANNRVLVFDAMSVTDGENAVAVIGQPDFTVVTSGMTASKLDRPWDVEYDGVRETLFVSDADNNRVLLFDVSQVASNLVATNVLGQQNFNSSGINLTQSGFRYPAGMAFDPINRSLYVGDRGHDRVLIYSIP